MGVLSYEFNLNILFKRVQKIEREILRFQK